MISLILPLIFLCLDGLQKSLLSIIFFPIIFLDLCIWFLLQTVFQFFDDLVLKPLIDLPPEKIEANDSEEIERGNIFIDNLMRQWRTRSTVINENFQFRYRNFNIQFGICSCLATIAPSFTRDGDALLTEQDGRTKIKARLTGGDLVLEGPILMGFLDFIKTLNAYVRIYRVTAYVEFDFDTKTLKSGNLINVHIEDVKCYFVEFREGSLLHYVLGVAASRFISLASSITKGIVQVLVEKYLPLKLEKFKFFVESASPSTSSWHPVTIRDSLLGN